MTPETGRYLEKAREALAEAKMIAEIGLAQAAGRAAYLAAFHGAQAPIFERSGRVARTHRGVHGQFLKLVQQDAQLGPDLPEFLSRAYNFKAVADYSIDPGPRLSLEQAEAAVTVADGFVARVTAAVAS